MSETMAGKARRKRNSLKRSAFIMAMTISLLLLAAVFLIDFLAFSRNVDEHYQTVGITLTKMAADTLDLDEVQKMTDAALAVYEDSGYVGVKPEEGSPAEVFGNPQSERLKSFLSKVL